MKKFYLVLFLFIAGCVTDKQFINDIANQINLYSSEDKSDNVVFVSEPAELTTTPVIEEPKKEEIPEVPIKETDLDRVDVWLNKNVKNWEPDVTITARLDKDTLYIDCDKMDWPTFTSNKKSVYGCVWAIVEVDGKLMASTWEFFKSKNGTRDISKISTIASASDHFCGYSKMKNWYLKKGDKIGIMVTAGNVRANKILVEKRSNVVWLIR